MSKAPKIIALAYSHTAIRAALIAFKGAEKGPATFEAVAPVFSAMLVSGGSKAELAAASATATVFIELHSDKLKTPTAKAFRATCITALADFKASGRAADQEVHDARLVALSAVWCSFFRDATPKAKDADFESPKATIARLQAELTTAIAERDAAHSAYTRDMADAHDEVARMTAERDAMALEVADLQLVIGSYQDDALRAEVTA